MKFLLATEQRARERQVAYEEAKEKYIKTMEEKERRMEERRKRKEEQSLREGGEVRFSPSAKRSD